MHAIVETRPQHAIDCEYQPKSAECEGIDCSCKETRLTAEQFWPEYEPPTETERLFSDQKFLYVLFDFAEAFRDKSESLNWKRQESCSECDGDGCAKCCRGCAGLREEIERLPQTVEDGFGSVWPPCHKHNITLQVMRPGDARCHECETEDYIDRLNQELTGLRAKLAEQECAK
jgi:hypothetical protein